MSGARINRMIQDLCASPESMARLRADPERAFDDYGLDAEDRAALLRGDAVAMVTGRGVHPILAFHFLFAMKPDLMQRMSIAAYPHLLED
jgi:hypothetical protein